MNAKSPDCSLPLPESWTAADGTLVTIRPIRAADLGLELAFVRGLSPRTGYQRLMSPRRPSLAELTRYTDIDYEREMALVATTTIERRERQIGVARYVKETAAEAEIAIVLADEWQGRGLGTRLLASLIAAARHRGVRRLVGSTLAMNTAMLALARRLGFRLTSDSRSATVTNVALDLAVQR